ncbi:MAG: EAL domain-containing protein [Terracidiphilus sp.]
MPNPPRTGIRLLIAIAVFLTPVLASAYLAWRECYATEKALSLSYARSVLRRMEETSGQLMAGGRALALVNLSPCSPEDIRLMQEIDLASSAVKVVGRVVDDRLICSSQGGANPISLGRPDLVTRQGVSIYFNKDLGSQPTHPLNVLAINGFAAIIDPSQTLDDLTERPKVEAAVFVPSSTDHLRVAAVGQYFPSNWLRQIGKGTQTTMRSGGYLVSLVRSPMWDLAVVTATPQSYIDRRFDRLAVLFLPIGILCGALLALLVSLLYRVRLPFPAMLRRAIKDGSLYVVYQPVVELATRRVVGAEALVRWRSRDADMRPDYFIPQAERYDMIQLITKQVLAIMARDLPQFLSVAPNFFIAVNFSAADLRDKRTLTAMDEFLRVSGARPENIEVEATERAFLQGPETAEVIDVLRAKGFSVAIDDFGTGYSSLSCLQSLSLDTLKIDRSFVDTINTDGATCQVVPHIIDMAHSLDLAIVAEGVETEPQAQYLVKRGVQYAQGWHFGRPMDPGLLCEQIRSHASAGKESVPAQACLRVH